LIYNQCMQEICLQPCFELTGANQCTPNNFRFMYSWKRVSQNSFPNFIYIFPKSFMKFWQELRNPKRIMKTKLESRLPRKSSWKSINYYILDLNSGHLHRKHVFCHWTIKARYNRSPQSYSCNSSWGLIYISSE
jgi:hypothetical protein